MPTDLKEVQLRRSSGGRIDAEAAATAAAEAAVYHLKKECQTEWQRDFGGLRARNDDEEEENVIYYMGIVDILQEFNMKKRLESAYKTRVQVLAGKDPTLISAVDSSVYAQRFVNFMTDHIR